MTARITNSTYCLCGDDLVVTTSTWDAVQVFYGMFRDLHTGDGHRLFATKAEAEFARREAGDGVNDRDLA